MSDAGLVDGQRDEGGVPPGLPPGVVPFRHALTDTPLSWRRVMVWSLYDWGTQPYHSVIITFVFAVYITSSPFGNVNDTTSALSLATGISGLFIALLAPVLGQSADRSGKTVTLLRVLTAAIVVLSAALFFIKPHPAYLAIGLTFFAAGTLAAEIASATYNATIDQVASGRSVGRVSGFGWGFGYIGGIVSLLTIYFAFIHPEVGLFGVTGAEGLDIRISMLFCAAWILLFTLAPLFMLRNQPPRVVEGRHPGVLGSYRELWRTLVTLWHTDRPLVTFLVASAVFRDGLAGVFTFGAVIAAGTFGFSAGDVIIFGAVANVTAGISTILCGFLDDRIGPRRVILFSLAALAVLGAMVFVFHAGGTTAFWLLGLGMTLFVGPAQSAARSYLARLIPEGRSGEVFGLYATTGRAISFLSPLFFGAAIQIGVALKHEDNSQYWGILGIVVLLIVGLVVMLKVREITPEQAAQPTR
jgi:MFS transporter, UMF1 family